MQRYLPEELRSRVNAFQGMLITAAGSILTILVGLPGEMITYRWCVTICGAVSMTACWLIIGGRKEDVRRVYEWEETAETN